MIITSGYRPEPINRQEGGKPESEHLYYYPEKGAIDFRIKDVSVHEPQKWCSKTIPLVLKKELIKILSI